MPRPETRTDPEPGRRANIGKISENHVDKKITQKLRISTLFKQKCSNIIVLFAYKIPILLFLRSNTIVGDRVHGTGMVVSRILKANIPVQNGIVHLIDKPLMVVARSLYDYLMEEGRDPENRLHEFAKLVRDKGGAFSEALLESKVNIFCNTVSFS